MADILSAESMTHVNGLISGHEFDRGSRLVVYDDTPCQFIVNRGQGSCGWHQRDHASELSSVDIEERWPKDDREAGERMIALARKRYLRIGKTIL